MKVIDVARQLIEQSGRSLGIVVTGLRAGEKMHEVLVSPGENPVRPFHPMIDHVDVPPLDLEEALAHGRVRTSGPGTKGDIIRIATYTGVPLTLEEGAGVMTFLRRIGVGDT